MLTELKNLLFKRRCFYILLIVLLIKVFYFSLTYQLEEATFLLLPDDSMYRICADRFKGELTENKLQEINRLFKEAEGADSAINSAYIGLVSGDIGYDEFCKVADKLSDTAANRYKGLGQFMRQVEYVQEDTESRHILDNRGWICLLRSDSPDWLLILLIIIIGTQTFNCDYSGNMYQMILTSKNGRLSLARKRVLSAVLLSALSVLPFSACEALTVLFSFGLPCGTSPLQSIQSLAESQFSLSLVSAFFMTLAVKIVGALLLCSLVLLISALTKKAVPTMCLSLILMIIPFVLLSGGNGLLYALPISLFVPNRFLAQSNAVQVLFSVSAAIIASAVMMLCDIYGFSGKSILRKGKKSYA